MRREEPDLYLTMLDMKITNPVVEDQINTDLPRTFPNNIYFDSSSSSSYQGPLYNILRAFANNNPAIGYCQGLNYIAGLLYLTTRDEDSSFWLLKVLCERILPDYYTQSMPGLLTDLKVLARLARREVPAVAAHIERLQMPWALFCSKWFVCLYCEVLPVETVLRVWDTVFYEGSKILFRRDISRLCYYSLVDNLVMKYFHFDAMPVLLYHKEPAQGTQSLSLVLYGIRLASMHRKVPLGVKLSTNESQAWIYLSTGGEARQELQGLRQVGRGHGLVKYF